MGQPICPTQGIAFAFPDVCLTPAPPAPPIPIPYPNIAQLADATAVADDLLLGPSSLNALLMDSEIATSSGDEAGSAGGVTSGTIKGACKVTGASSSVKYGGKGIARFGDTTSQNRAGETGNATGTLLGAFPTVLVGG